MKLTTKYLLALITTLLLLLNLSVAEAVRPSRTHVLFPGDPYQGGIVFWVDQTGQHGLIAARADQSSGIQWYNGTYFVTNATADGIYAGAKNTEVIISTQTTVGLACTATPLPSYCSPPTNTAPYAALVAANYSIQDDGVTPCTGGHIETCWGDWYLPSKIELKLMKYSIATDNEGTIRNLGKLTLGSLYWTSTESSQGDAWVQTMAANTSTSSQDKSNTYRVRAIRRF